MRRRRKPQPRASLIDAARERYARDEMTLEQFEGAVERHLRYGGTGYAVPSWYFDSTMKAMYRGPIVELLDKPAPSERPD